MTTLSLKANEAKKLVKEASKLPSIFDHKEFFYDRRHAAAL
jgi:hypothetical protein